MIETFFPPEDEPPPKLGFASRLLIRLAGADPDFVIRKCPEDIGNLKAAGSIALGSFMFNSAVFTSVGSHLAGHFSFPVAVGGIGLAAYTLTADSWNYFRCDHIPSGIKQLSQASMDVKLPSEVRNARRRALAVRLAQSIGVSAIVAVTTMLAIYSDDIHARIRLNDQRANAPVIQQLGDQASSDLKRANDAVKTTTSNITLLNRQINAQLARRRNAAGGLQLQALETRRKAEEANLAAEKADLAKATDALRNGTAVGAASQAGLLSQITALEQIGGDDWKIFFFILLCMGVSAAFDLMPVIAKINWLPTKYARLKAQEFLDSLDATVDEMAPAEADPISAENASVSANDNIPRKAEPANDNQPLNGQDRAANGAVPARRPRGRPRKNPPASEKLEG